MESGLSGFGTAKISRSGFFIQSAIFSGRAGIQVKVLWCRHKRVDIEETAVKRGK